VAEPSRSVALWAKAGGMIPEKFMTAWVLAVCGPGP
jgi:hypothetical protein